MAELTEAQLLLLDNFMYIDQSTTTGASIGDVISTIDVNNIPESALSGGITPDQAADIIREIQSDPTLCNLTITNSLDTDGVRATCFVDSNGDATVAFRGTGGTYEAWNDNLLGEYMTDTPCQQAAADFMRQLEMYDNITVTGHSKGGNLAQYCTVVLGDRIDRCISFDGQGFCQAFLDKYASEVAAASGKISSVCCESDYVNILLTSIAGETRYLHTQPGANAHYSWQLYLFNRKMMDEQGRFNATTNQSELMADVDKLADSLVKGLGKLPGMTEEGVADWLASIVGFGMGIVMSGDKDAILNFLIDNLCAEFKIAKSIVNEILDSPLISGGVDLINNIISAVTGSGVAGNVKFSVSPVALRTAAVGGWHTVDEALSKAMLQIADIKSTILGLSGLEAINIAVFEARLAKRKIEVKDLRDTIGRICQRYIDAETNIMK